MRNYKMWGNAGRSLVVVERKFNFRTTINLGKNQGIQEKGT